MADLIDRAALLNIYKNWLSQLTAPEDAGDRNGVETCIAVLQDAPIIEAEPVRHGKWKLIGANKLGRGGNWKCDGRDGCGKLYPHKCDYCPNCGAKMDLEVDEGL